jgi:hypothetical protein
MSTNAHLRSELADALRFSLGQGVNVYDSPPDTIAAPAVIIGGIDWQWSTIGDGGRVATVPLFLAVSRRNTSYLADLDALADPAGPVVSTFDDDPDELESWVVTNVGNYRDLTIADVDYYAATVTVEVFC